MPVRLRIHRYSKDEYLIKGDAYPDSTVGRITRADDGQWIVRNGQGKRLLRKKFKYPVPAFEAFKDYYHVKEK